MTVDGNTPTGEYQVERMEATGDWNQSSYGPNGALRLRPVSGNALAAEQIAGRQGLLVHGGSPSANGYWRGGGELRATHGCLRLRDQDVKRLANLLFEASNDPKQNQCEPINVRLTVTDYDASFLRPK
jgi:lipoprotein-anchoring transpeptidase ErfK/SrfK